MRRVLYFVLTNIAVLVVLTFVLNVLGVDSYLDDSGLGLNLTALLIFSAVFGMGGSFVSLLLSKWMAKRMTGAQVIEQPRSAGEQWLFETVSNQAKAAGIRMPEVAIFPSDAPNAFATGARRDAALVAVSTGLIERMSRDEVEAVLGHEISHIGNGDMITLALIQGVLNTFVFFLARVIGHVVDQALFRGENNRGGYGIGYFVVVIAAQILLGILASMIVFYFSRRREFRADAGGARLAGANNMIAALERLKAAHLEPLPEQMKAFGISGTVGRGFRRLMMTHPPLDERIQALRQLGG